MTESNHCCFPKWWYPPNKIDDLGASHGFVPHPSLCPILFPGGTYQVVADLRMRRVSTNKIPSNQKRNYDRWIHSNLRFLASFLQSLSRVTNVTQDDMESPMEKEGLKHRSFDRYFVNTKAKGDLCQRTQTQRWDTHRWCFPLGVSLAVRFQTASAQFTKCQTKSQCSTANRAVVCCVTLT